MSTAMEVEKKDKRGESESSSEQVVNPWEVSAKDGGKIDYDKLIDKFGCKRDFNEILDAYERGDKFYLYTGRGPSSDALHLGHLIPFMFTKYLQDAFKVPLVIQLTDDEKFIWKNSSVEKSKRFAKENVKDIIACGFDVSRTFIFSDFGFVGGKFYENMVRISKCLTVNKATSIFGFRGEDPIGKLSFPAVQAAPSFPSSFPHLFDEMEKQLRCLIPCAIDQSSQVKFSLNDLDFIHTRKRKR